MKPDMNLSSHQYASTPRRGVFLSLFALMVSSHFYFCFKKEEKIRPDQVGFGVLLCYSLGLGMAWRPICLVVNMKLLLKKKSIFCSKVPVLILVNGVFLLPLPESPVWLLGHRFTYN